MLTSIQIIYALLLLITISENDLFIYKKIIYHIAYALLYVAILQNIKELTVKNEKINKIIHWIIRLEMIKATGSVLVAFTLLHAGILVTMCKLILLVLYTILAIHTFLKKNNQSKTITLLRPFGLSVIAQYVTAVIFITLMRKNPNSEVVNLILTTSIKTITSCFLIYYFNAMKHPL